MIHALTAMLYAWQTTLDQGEAVRVVLVDFKKGFDFANHNLRLQKLLYQWCSTVPH